MTEMESPKRKMQKKNDYQRHKLFRKIKRRRKALAQADLEVAEKLLKRKLKLPKFGDGKSLIKSDSGAPLEVKDGMLYYKETGEPFYSAGLLLPEVEIVGDKSKVNPWAAAGKHNTSPYWDPNGVVHGIDKSVEAAIRYPAMLAELNGADTSGYYDKVAKVGKWLTAASPTKWIGALRGTGMPWDESNEGLFGSNGETGKASDELMDLLFGAAITKTANLKPLKLLSNILHGSQVEGIKSGINLAKRGAKSVNDIALKAEDIVAKFAKKAASKNKTLAQARRRIIKTTAEKTRDRQRIRDGAESFSQKYPLAKSLAQNVSNNAAKRMREKLKDSGNPKFTETYVLSSDVLAAKENFNKLFDEAITKNAEYANESIDQLVNDGVITANNTEYAEQLFNKYPEYALFCREHKLNPELSSTVDLFLETQSRVTRGGNIATKDADINIGDDKLLKINEAGEKMLSDNSVEAASKRTGGDRLNTNGLYTSNGYNMSDHYSRFNSTGADYGIPDNYGFIAILKDLLAPSQGLSLEQKLASRHNAALNFDFLNSLEPIEHAGYGVSGNYVTYVPKNQDLKFKTSKFNFNKNGAPEEVKIENGIPVELGNLRDLPDVRYVESNYATRTGANFRNINERSYLPGYDLDIVSKEVSHNAPDMHGRYGFRGFPNNPEIDPSLFYQTVPSVVDYQKYYDLIFKDIKPELALPNTRGNHLIRDYAKRNRESFERIRENRYAEYRRMIQKSKDFNDKKIGLGVFSAISLPSIYAAKKYADYLGNEYRNNIAPLWEQYKHSDDDAEKYNSYINEAFNLQLHKLGEHPAKYMPISTDGYNRRLLEQIDNIYGRERTK